jgi:hypothetical protein
MQEHTTKLLVPDSQSGQQPIVPGFNFPIPYDKG